MRNLKNKVAVVTGAGAGIGRAIAIRLADEGCNLAISDINKEALSETKDLLKGKNIKICSDILDVSDKEAMAAYPEKVVKKLGGVDIVINNAGVCVIATVEEHTVEDYEWLMGVNFWGVLYGSKFFIPYLKKTSEACIVNMSSVFGLISMPNMSSYNSAKFAIRGFSESLRHELCNTNIRVMTVHPGGVKTDMSKHVRFKSTPGNSDHDQFNDIFTRFSMSTPERTAKKIIKGVKKKKKRILVGPDAKSGDFIQRLMPVGYGWFVRLIASKV